jgi:hypothetical protein
MDPCQRIEGFLSLHEVTALERLLRAKSSLLTETAGSKGLGPRYAVIDGEQIRRELPELEALGETRVRPLLERFAGRRVELLASPRRSMRVQVYRDKRHGFRWHFDAHPYAAMVTLENTNGGQTQVVPEGWSRVLRFLLYPLYPFPGVFSLAPRRALTMNAGDLLLLCGARVLHRGVTLRDGERTLLFYAYDVPGRKPNALRDRVARWLNY